MTLTQARLDDIKKHAQHQDLGFWVEGHVVEITKVEYDALINAAQAHIDTADHVVISKAEYDYLIARDFRLKELEV